MRQKWGCALSPAILASTTHAAHRAPRLGGGDALSPIHPWRRAPLREESCPTPGTARAAPRSRPRPSRKPPAAPHDL
eukprot:183048-Prymnesium_polylepis.1